MDHTFSATTGAIRQHQQSVRNSLSSPHNLYRISPANNTLGTNNHFSKTSPTGSVTSGFTSGQQTFTSQNPGNVPTYFRIPTALPVQRSQQNCNFRPGSSGVYASESPYLQGGVYNRVGINQFPTHQTRNRSQANSNVPVVPFSGFVNTANTSVCSSLSYTNPLIENNYRNRSKQFPNFNNRNHSQLQMPNNQNMNKNRYANPQNNMAANVHGNTIESSSNNAASNVKALIQQISQSQAQPQLQHNANNNMNNANNAPASNNASPQTQPQPQYRIFKRGDSIPGLSSPIQISSISNNENNQNSSNNIGKGNVSNPKSKSEVTGNSLDSNGKVNNSDSEITNGTDKENSNVISIKDGLSINSGSGPPNGTRTPLSQIGEIARFHNLTVEYRLVKETGPPHAPTFTVILRLGNDDYSGEGSSIKKAQHAAAVEALEKMALARPPPRTKPKKPFTPGGNKRPNWALVQLTALAQELQMQLQFLQQPVPIVDPFRRGDPPSVVSVHVGERSFTGEGANFSSAKNMAVMVALKAMLKVKQEMELAKLAKAGNDEQNMDSENKSPISIVHEMAMKRGLSVGFEIVQETGPPHMKVFTVKCKVGEDLETEGQGPTKQAAKKACSELMMAKLKEIPIALPATSQGVNLKAMQRGIFRQKAAKKKSSTPVVKDLEKQTVSPISKLIQIAHIKKYKEPEFTLVSTGTESNVENFLKQITERDRRMLRKKKPVFTIEVTVGPHTSRGTGPNKKAAKKSAAEAAIIALGYGPTEELPEELSVSTSPESVSNGQGTTDVIETTTTTTKVSHSSGKSTCLQNDGKTNASGTVKLAGARQIAPGIIVLKSETSISPGTTTTAVAQEMKKINKMTPALTSSTREGIEKLAYLSRLLEITVSYSDFPKKNEYLSVVSLTTNPPHVAHGCGATLDEAQNAAALKILEELSTMGLDSVTAAAEKPTE